MVRLHFSAVLITVILSFLAIKVNSNDILSWEEDHFIKELSDKDIPEDCQQIGICSNITIYDSPFVNKQLRKLSKFNKYFKEVPEVYSTSEEEHDKLCESKEEKIWPQAAKDEEGTWYYIVNTDDIRFQGFRIHKCLKRDSRCSKEVTFDGFDDACYQEFYFRNMVYLDVQNKKFGLKKFQVPSCCSCKLQKRINQISSLKNITTL